ncbi:MAG TPA: hypothetical protein VHZ51_26480 [Ktedonobacteraceae bacterium]|jgi:hypothetical protein|nr:hypothetical protein [Ktedonobacteraceae bacterium]
MRQDVPHEAKVQEPVQEVWWNPAEWPAPVAFLVGMPVGFLFRPLQPPGTLAGPVPLYFSLWGAWWVPVVVLGSLMWLKIAAVLFWQKKRPAFWRVAGAHLAWLIGLFALFCGIAPLDTLQHLGLGGPPANSAYALLNPLAVGLVAAFIFDVSRPIRRAGRGIWLALLAWLGTAFCFLVLLTFYGVVVPQQQHLGRCAWFCSSNPVTLDFNTWFLWVPIGLILVALGGFFGVVLCFVTLGQRNG